MNPYILAKYTITFLIFWHLKFIIALPFFLILACTYQKIIAYFMRLGTLTPQDQIALLDTDKAISNIIGK
jgi:hypothetical protein